MNKNNCTGSNLTEKVPIKHFLLIMRTAFILLFTCVFCSMADMSYTQNARVNINKTNTTLKEVLTAIEKQTDYLFIYNNEVNTNEKVSVKAKHKAVSEVLYSILENKDINYSMEGNNILLSKVENVNTEEIYQKGVSSKENHSGLGLWKVRQILMKNNNLNLFTTKDNEFFTQQFEIFK